MRDRTPRAEINRLDLDHTPGFAGRADYNDRRRAHWDRIAEAGPPAAWLGGYYHRRLADVYQFLVGNGRRVLELGCGTGDLLAACRPTQGVGIDLSPGMIERARQRHPDLEFHVGDAHEPQLEDTFDVVILSDLVNDLWDVQRVFEVLRDLTAPHSRIILNFYSRLWELPLTLAESAGMARPMMAQNWLTIEDVRALLSLAGFETLRDWREILYPIQTPLVSPFVNRVLARLWPIHYLCLTNFVLARPEPQPVQFEPNVSVVIPVRNEAGNIRGAIERTPEMGNGTELVFVEGHSTDDTHEVLQEEIEAHGDRDCQLLVQPGEGKGDAVRYGFEHANGEMLMILDGDLTVPPEDLVRFYQALVSGRAEFANGVRLVYPIEGQAMRFLNLLGNKLFSWTFSWLLGQPVKDTLCGTKALWKRDYEELKKNRAYFGEFDPFGDFDLLFGAAKLNLKIADIPIRYRRRRYGATNIQRWRHGSLLLRMVGFAASRLKFV